MNTFTHLHTHTSFTKNNSTLEIDDLVRRAKTFGMQATAIVDSGTIAGFPAFTAACAEHGITPIYGCGFYLARGSHRAPTRRSHLVLLVYTEQGMQNLIALDAIAQSEGFHDGKAHIDDVLLAEYSDGLICLTGGLGGDIDQYILANEMETAVRRALFYRRIFGENFYLELQDHGSPKNRVAIDGLVEISKQTGIQTIVTQGAFYLQPSDASACNELRKKNGNKTLNGKGYHFASPTEMSERFNDFPAALTHTKQVAKQCMQKTACSSGRAC